MAGGTVLFVHAHPDDEAVFTAGASLQCARDGHRVVLVTCTNGRRGLDQRVRAGNDPRHDGAWVVRTRAAELADAAALVGVHRVVTLGYDDSGLADWPRPATGAPFCETDVASVARVLGAVIDEEAARVVVTYDESGYYGHPDHVQAHRATVAAVADSATVERLYYPVTPRTLLRAFVPRAEAAGARMPLWVSEARPADDEQVAVTIDATAFSAVKRAAIAAHASQVDNAELTDLPPELFAEMFGREFYRLGWSRTPPTGPTNDLFGGLP